MFASLRVTSPVYEHRSLLNTATCPFERRATVFCNAPARSLSSSDGATTVEVLVFGGRRYGRLAGTYTSNSLTRAGNAYGEAFRLLFTFLNTQVGNGYPRRESATISRPPPWSWGFPDHATRRAAAKDRRVPARKPGRQSGTRPGWRRLPHVPVVPTGFIQVLAIPC